MNRNLKTRANNGFTIIELIVVVTVICLLVAIAVGAYNKGFNDAKVTKSLAFGPCKIPIWHRRQPRVRVGR